MSLRDHAGINAGDPTVPRLMESVLRPPPWMEEALCAQVDADIFFPDKGMLAKPAKTICSLCPVREECLAYALAFESGANGTATSYIFVGIYGGLSPKERRHLVRTAQQEAS